MHQKERIGAITELLKKNGFVTVKFLTDELHYSTATINRDLNVMEKQKLVKRSYGGAELIKSKAVPLVFRYNKMRPAKNKIGKRAAQLIEDNDIIFVDGSTTAQYIGKYITDKKNITVITNNLSLATFLSEYNIEVICLGGRIVEPPSMLFSSETVENVRKHRADKMFFSVGSVTEDGKIGMSELYYLMHKDMRENSDKAYLLIDHEKINRPYSYILGDLSFVDGIVSDFQFSDAVKQKYNATEFIEID